VKNHGEESIMTIASTATRVEWVSRVWRVRCEEREWAFATKEKP
jgi:hypothetical protein